MCSIISRQLIIPVTSHSVSLNNQVVVKPLYLNNSYQFSHTAIITAQGEATLTDKKIHWIRLNETIFHPQGGGQPSDQGAINGIPVIKAVKVPLDGIISPNTFEINHCLAPDHSLKVGQVVNLKINEEVRRQNMRLHTTGHLLAAVVEKLFPTLKAINGHHFPGEARVVFEGESYPDQAVALIQIKKEMEKLILQKTPSVATLSKLGNRMQIIQGFPGISCGGTHLSHLGEIGGFSVRQWKITKKRLHISYQ